MIRSTNNIYINSVEPSAFDYLELLKIRVMRLAIFTAGVAMIIAPIPLNPFIALGSIVCIALGAGACFVEGYIVQLSTDRNDWYHIPKRIGQHGDYFDDVIVGKFNDSSLPGTRVLAGGNHKHVMLSSWILHTHTNEGDLSLIHISEPTRPY